MRRAGDRWLPHRLFLLISVIVFVSLLLLGIFAREPSRVFLNQRRAVLTIRNVNMAERRYAVQHPDIGFACKLTDLGEEGLVDRVVASGTRAGYHFELQCGQHGSPKGVQYTIVGLPVVPGKTGVYALCSNESSDIWYSENGSAGDCIAKHLQVERKYRE
jgi:hypothetical protein